MQVDLRKPKDRPRRRDSSWDGVLAKRDGREVCATKAAWSRRRDECYEMSKIGTFVPCFFCGSHVGRNDYHCHHKNGTRGLGGGKRDDRLSNLAAVHTWCHNEYHRNPSAFDHVDKKEVIVSTTSTHRAMISGAWLRSAAGVPCHIEVSDNPGFGQTETIAVDATWKKFVTTRDQLKDAERGMQLMITTDALLEACRELIVLEGDYNDETELMTRSKGMAKEFIIKAAQKNGCEVTQYNG